MILKEWIKEPMPTLVNSPLLSKISRGNLSKNVQVFLLFRESKNHSKSNILYNIAKRPHIQIEDTIK